MLKTALERIARVGRGVSGVHGLSQVQKDQLADLREKGYVMFDHLVGTERLKRLQAEYRERVENKLDFEFPVLAQAKIDPDRDAALIESNFLATPRQLAERGLTFSRGDVSDYKSAVEKFQPSTLTTYLPDEHDWYDLWLDPNILPVAQAYMGFIPQLTEAYIHHNFPARFVVMNHA